MIVVIKTFKDGKMVLLISGVIFCYDADKFL